MAVEQAQQRGWSTWVATLTAAVLGAFGAVMDVAGHQPWDGPQVASFTATHGLHAGDASAIVPFVVGLVLARWCWRHGR